MKRSAEHPAVASLSAAALRAWSEDRWCVAVIPTRDQDPDRLLAAIGSVLAQPEVLGVVVADGGSAPGPARDRVDYLPMLFDGGAVHVVRTMGSASRPRAVAAGCAQALVLWPHAALVAVVDSGCVLRSGAVTEAALRLYGDDGAGWCVASVERGAGVRGRLAGLVGPKPETLVVYLRRIVADYLDSGGELQARARAAGWRGVRARRSVTSAPPRPDGWHRFVQPEPTFWVESGPAAGSAVEIDSPVLDLLARRARRP